MTILQANKFHYVKGGAERYYLDVSRLLAGGGHTVVPFAMEDRRNEPTPYARWFVRGVDYRGRLGLAARAREALRAIDSAETMRKAAALVAETRPAVAHLHNIYHQLSPSLITALDRCGVPMVQSLHDYKIICPGYLLMTHGEICERCKGGRYFNAVLHKCLLDSTPASIVGWIEATLHARRGTYGKVARFLCPSRFLLEKFAEFGVPREKLVHFPYFLPLDDYAPAYAPADYFIYLGRLSREKGIATLLQALRERSGTRLTCRILGEGPLEGELKRRAAEWKLGRVEFSGYLQGEALQRAIREAAFTVVPSEWYENLPFSVLESFALGTPVVGSRIGGIPEMVLDRETGLTFAPGEATELAAAIDWMEAHPSEAVEMGRRARRMDEERYAPEPHLRRLVELYREVIAAAAPAGVG
ncbi:MAG: glycosyltransferase family 4 protein [Candidatus Eisenbacteria bacterium]|uniref:Glycosyltransferase family 4 protein n=1 Tax=Eiseniibacteriota bacterium TaxID=2212470 RepID=A0A938BNY5_UNCEI|nr:glycosyltransferase family 4 protein [Candidatus Eisenbacteria bacterium]